MATIKIDPMTRLEGHLSIEVEVDGGVISDAKSSGTMFRGFENILMGRSPLDAPHLTQRICGVCPISHGMASCLNLESAFNVTPPANGRILRNLVLGANFVMSHILHFYHLAALDYINTDGVLGGAIDKGPWQPHYVAPDMVTGDTAAALVGHYVQALAMRRKAHQMGAIFGGKLPCAPTLVPGGCTAVPTTENIAAFRALLTELRTFIGDAEQGTYIPDVLTVAGAFPAYFGIGAGCGNLLAYGVFDLDNSDENKLLYRGRYTDGSVAEEGVEPAQINEDLKYSRYDDAGSGLNPADGITEQDANKANPAYSWLKAPRYQGIVHEVGPLARMAVNYLSGDTTTIGLIESVLGANPDISVLFSVLGRHAARALEAKLVADAMDGWLNELDVGRRQTAYEEVSVPKEVTVGIGLTEAPRGALGHWITTTRRGKIDRYQVITPTNWNASPKDDLDQNGPIEQALIGTPAGDMTDPTEVEILKVNILRIVHSFDPCLACSVHMVRPGKDKPVATVQTRPSI